MMRSSVDIKYFPLCFSKTSKSLSSLSSAAMQASKLSESLLGFIVRFPEPLSLNRKSILSEMHKMEKGYFGTKWMFLTNQPAMGFAWMVTALMVASTPFRGRWFFGFTGIRSSSSKVSQPSITFPNTVYLEQGKIWSGVPSVSCSLEVKGGLGGICEEPLAAVGVGSRVGHWENSSGLVLQVILDLILVSGFVSHIQGLCKTRAHLKFPSPNALTPFSSICWVSSLYHEALGRAKMSVLHILAFALILSQVHLDVSCEHAIVVVVCSTQGQEIFTSLMKYILDLSKYKYFPKIFCKPLQIIITNHLVPWGIAHKRAPFWCLPHSCEPWQTC